MKLLLLALLVFLVCGSEAITRRKRQQWIGNWEYGNVPSGWSPKYRRSHLSWDSSEERDSRQDSSESSEEDQSKEKDSDERQQTPRKPDAPLPPRKPKDPANPTSKHPMKPPTTSTTKPPPPSTKTTVGSPKTPSEPPTTPTTKPPLSSTETPVTAPKTPQKPRFQPTTTTTTKSPPFPPETPSKGPKIPQIPLPMDPSNRILPPEEAMERGFDKMSDSSLGLGHESWPYPRYISNFDSFAGNRVRRQFATNSWRQTYGYPSVYQPWSQTDSNGYGYQHQFEDELPSDEIQQNQDQTGIIQGDNQMDSQGFPEQTGIIVQEGDIRDQVLDSTEQGGQSGQELIDIQQEQSQDVVNDQRIQSQPQYSNEQHHNSQEQDGGSQEDFQGQDQLPQEQDQLSQGQDQLSQEQDQVSLEKSTISEENDYALPGIQQASETGFQYSKEHQNQGTLNSKEDQHQDDIGSKEDDLQFPLDNNFRGDYLQSTDDPDLKEGQLHDGQNVDQSQNDQLLDQEVVNPFKFMLQETATEEQLPQGVDVSLTEDNEHIQQEVIQHQDEDVGHNDDDDGQDLKSKLKNQWNKLEKTAKDTWDQVERGADKAIDKIEGAAGKTWDKISNFFG